MINRPGPKDAFLQNILTLLIDEWGASKVKETLSRIVQQSDRLDSPPSYRAGRSKAGTVSSPKQDRVERLIEGSNIPEEKRPVIRVILSDFYGKRFLPTISDVRHFLEMHGRNAGRYKIRLEAMKALVETLRNIEPQRLERIAKEGAYSGPAQLGPLSDAIKSIAALTRGNISTPNSEDDRPPGGDTSQGSAGDDHEKR